MMWYGEALDALRCVQHARGVWVLVCAAARGARGASCPLIESVLMRSLSRSRNDCGGMYVSYM